MLYNAFEQVALSSVLFLCWFSVFCFFVTNGFATVTASAKQSKRQRRSLPQPQDVAYHADAARLKHFSREVSKMLTATTDERTTSSNANDQSTTNRIASNPSSDNPIVPPSVKTTTDKSSPVTLTPPLPTTKKMPANNTATAATEIIPDSQDIQQFVSSLRVRTARKIAKKLGIRQKVNGKDKKLDQLKREIQQALRKDSALLGQAKSVIAA